MSSVHCVVVWEFQSGGQWIPHTPGVTRTLERAHAKKLTRVVLSDADPALKGHHVNLRTLTQCRDMPDGGTTECLVRRSCYSVQSVGGRGVRWEWARLSSPPLPAELHYEPMPMEMQCSVESAWCSGAERVSHGGWALCPAGGLARRGAAVRLVRRAPQPPYPLTRQPPATAPPAPAPAPPPLAPHVQDTLHHAGVYRCIPQQHTGSSVQAMAGAGGGGTGGGGGGTRALGADRKPNLARQILHNLNIFSSKPAVGPGDAAQLLEPQLSEVQVSEARLSEARLSEARLSEAQLSESGRTDTESGSTRSLRRHSVDTVSTYLSHESKDSMQRGSVGELLNCSGGSDDVFEARDDDSTDDQRDVCMDVDVDACMDGCAWWTRVSCPQWGAVCPVCMRALAGARGGAGGAAGGGGAVALVRCQHMLHHHCLAQLLRTAAAAAAHTDNAWCAVTRTRRGRGVPPCPRPRRPPPLRPSRAPPPPPPPPRSPPAAWRGACSTRACRSARRTPLSSSHTISSRVSRARATRRRASSTTPSASRATPCCRTTSSAGRCYRCCARVGRAARCSASARRARLAASTWWRGARPPRPPRRTTTCPPRASPASCVTSYTRCTRCSTPTLRNAEAATPLSHPCRRCSHLSALHLLLLVRSATHQVKGYSTTTRYTQCRKWMARWQQMHSTFKMKLMHRLL